MDCSEWIAVGELQQADYNGWISVGGLQWVDFSEWAAVGGSQWVDHSGWITVGGLQWVGCSGWIAMGLNWGHELHRVAWETEPSSEFPPSPAFPGVGRKLTHQLGSLQPLHPLLSLSR